MALTWGVRGLPWPPQPTANHEHEAAESGLRKRGPSVLVAGESLPQPWEQGPRSLVLTVSNTCCILPLIMFCFVVAMHTRLVHEAAS